MNSESIFIHKDPILIIEKELREINEHILNLLEMY